MSEALEKFLRVAAIASRNDVYPCRPDNETIEKCIDKYPVDKLTPEDIEAFRAGLLAERLDAQEMDKMFDDVFLKFVSDQSWEEMFKTSVRMFLFSCHESIFK